MPAHSSGPEISTIGKYQLIANLGHGGMADVYLAVVHGPVGFNKLTVIKRLRPSLADEPEFLAMFLDEARLAARLNHPNVVQTNEVAEVDGIYFIAMEYLDGQPLNRVLHRLQKQAELPRELLLRVVADSLAGLHHAHELTDYDGSPLGVVHRDASPHNIFVTYDGQTKVVDFGIAKAASRSSETRDGVLKGKVAYMAPEQSKSENVDRRADVFAMGLVTWEVLTGARLRRGSDLEILDRISRGDVPPLSSAWPDCPAELARIVAKSTALSMHDRYATANEMRQDIVAYLDSVSVRSSSEEVGRMVSALFEHKRTEMKAIIERQLSGLRRASTEEVGLRVVDARRLAATDSMELPRVSLPSSPSAPSGMSGATPSAPSMRSAPSAPSMPSSESSSSARGSGPTSATATATLPAMEAPRRSRAPFVIAAVAVAAAVTVLALRNGDPGGSGASGATASTGSAAVTSAAPATAAVTASDAARADASTIEVKLSAKPDGAKMFLDDAALTNPFTGRFHRDDKEHTLRVEADGYTTATRAISFGSDQTIEVALEHAAAQGARPSGGAAAGTATATFDDDALPTPKPTAKPTKSLDGDDPWAK
ncbi:MAG: serine/threonine-protein kinase [Polyangiaceae bacterium]